MADNEKKIEDGTVVSMDYTLRSEDAEGEVLDSSEGRAPLQFMQGRGQIVKGLERELYGMGVGEEKKVTVEPEDAYGEFDPEAFVEVPLSAFPDNMAVEPGTGLSVRDDSGNLYEAYVAEVREQTALLDFNHPLAGQTLHFDVRIADLRDATAEEAAHGHVHDDGEEQA